MISQHEIFSIYYDRYLSNQRAALLPILLIFLFMPFPASSAETLIKCPPVSSNEGIWCNINHYFSPQMEASSGRDARQIFTSDALNLQNQTIASICDDILIDDSYQNSQRFDLFLNLEIKISNLLHGLFNKQAKSSICFRSGPSIYYSVLHQLQHFPKGIKLLKNSDGWILFANMQNKQLGWVKDIYFTGSKIDGKKHLVQNSRSRDNAQNITRVSQQKKNESNQKTQTRKNHLKENLSGSKVIPNETSSNQTLVVEDENNHDVNKSNETENSPRPLFSNQTEYPTDHVFSVFDANSEIPYFAEHVTEQLLNHLQYAVFQDPALYSTAINLNIWDQIIPDRITSVASVTNSELQSEVVNKIYYIESGQANFDKFMLHDDGHMSVDYGSGILLNSVKTPVDTNNFDNQISAYTITWAYMPLIFVSRKNIDRVSPSASVRVRHIYRSGEYSDCNHVIIDGFQEYRIKHLNSFIVGDAELCFNATGKKAKISYGYELWQPLTLDNRSTCLSIDTRGRMCRMSDSRQRPLVSYWSTID